MLKNILLSVLVSLLFSVCACAQKDGAVVADSSMVQPRYAADYEDEGDDEEIGNFDFLYNDGEIFNYDQILVANLMQEAMSHLGARYRSGSKGPNTFDCSGFTSYVYKQQGATDIGCSSRDQYALNIPVKRNDLQPGDLVFFTSPRSGRNVGHVGIVVSVNPLDSTFEFIHASSKEGVKISKSTDGFYARRYVGARRVQ